MPFPDFNNKSLQADWVFRKTSAAMVQETKEPGQTESAQEISGGQVNEHTNILCLLNIDAHKAVEL